jgi:Ca2+:H+ antiporter
LKASLLGDILSNNLFIVGCCFMIGGFQHREQYFNMSVISTMSFIMAVSAIIMAVPTTIHFIVEHFGLSKGLSDNTPLAHGCALILLLIYSAFLAFQLRTHTDLFDDENCEADANEEENEPVLPIWASIITLIICIALVALCAQTLILNIGTIVEITHSSKTFVGFVIIPFLSNTVTTFTAVSVALLDKMDLAISVTIGSSLQILLFVAPLLVVIAWTIGRDLTLSFGILEAVLLLLSSFVAILILQKGRSTYLDGVLCLGLYIVIVMTMFVYASDSMV